MICPDCGGGFEVAAFIDAPAAIRKILEHLRVWDLPARPPPAPLLGRKMSELPPGPQPHQEPELETWASLDSFFRDDLPAYADWALPYPPNLTQRPS